LKPIQAFHATCALAEPEQVAAWRGEPPALELPEPAGRLFPLEPPAPDALAGDPLHAVIQRRGSSRRFHQQPIGREKLATILHRAIHGFAADFSPSSALSLGHAYLIVNAVDGLPGGAYVYHPERRALELLREGSFRREAGALALGQELGSDAAVNVYFLADLEPILTRFGNRGYRAAQLEASVAAGWIYLAAYAQSLGATGLTFYDDGVTEFFAPHAAGKSVLFLMAVGQPAPRR
jgi:SagB-type dehydrogenase family enzyme